MQVDMELDLFLGNGNVWYAGPTNAGLHVPVVIDVLNRGAPSPTPLQLDLQHMSLWWSLGAVPLLWSWCSAPSVRPQPQRAARLLRQPERLVHFSCAWLQAPPPGAGVGFQQPGSSLSPLSLGAKSMGLASCLALPWGPPSLLW